MTISDQTTVIIVGAGVAGLTLGNLLQSNGIDCVILERRSREYADQRQRAGTIDSFGVRLLREWGLGEAMRTDDVVAEEAGGMWIDGEAMPIEVDEGDGDEDGSVYLPQQVLVRNLTDAFLEGGGDLRFEAVDVALTDIATRPRATYRDAEGALHAVEAAFVAGADGDHGVSRASIPLDALTRYTHEFGYSWLSIQAGVAANPSGMAIHDRGFAAMIPRGSAASRLYLQIAATDTATDWPDERVWAEMAARFGTPMPDGPIIDKRVIPLRSAVTVPMQYGQLFLLGDAAHIVPPMSAKGMHLALHDAEVLARALIRFARESDRSLLDSYSDDALPHIWNYQAFAAWITRLMHNAGDPSHDGEFAKQIARAELQRQFLSPAANRLFSELTAGVN
ncbi:MAG: 4-hydroxybenzoate 3-monooxygenase [Arachnia sp.]